MISYTVSVMTIGRRILEVLAKLAVIMAAEELLGKFRVIIMNKIYLISQNENMNYDTYDSAVVVAPDEKTARQINPSMYCSTIFMEEKDWNKPFSNWCSSPNRVKVKYIGIASEDQKVGVVCSSFNAG